MSAQNKPSSNIVRGGASSIKERIEDSTLSIINGKNDIRQTLINKGVTSIPENPTFLDLKNGINNLGGGVLTYNNYKIPAQNSYFTSIDIGDSIDIKNEFLISWLSNNCYCQPLFKIDDTIYLLYYVYSGSKRVYFSKINLITKIRTDIKELINWSDMWTGSAMSFLNYGKNFYVYLSSTYYMVPDYFGKINYETGTQTEIPSKTDLGYFVILQQVDKDTVLASSDLSGTKLMKYNLNSNIITNISKPNPISNETIKYQKSFFYNDDLYTLSFVNKTTYNLFSVYKNKLNSSGSYTRTLIYSLQNMARVSNSGYFNGTLIFFNCLNDKVLGTEFNPGFNTYVLDLDTGVLVEDVIGFNVLKTDSEYAELAKNIPLNDPFLVMTCLKSTISTGNTVVLGVNILPSKQLYIPKGAKCKFDTECISNYIKYLPNVEFISDGKIDFPLRTIFINGTVEVQNVEFNN